MAPREQFTNLAATTLASAAGSSDATITVASSASFPASGNFRLIIDTELLLCTGVSGVTLTVTPRDRGHDGGLARQRGGRGAHPDGRRSDCSLAG